jgi:hypothetical protein
MVVVVRDLQQAQAAQAQVPDGGDDEIAANAR